MAENLVHINLLGTRFSIETDEEPEYLYQLIHKLEDRLSQLEKATGLQEPLKIALLAGLFLEDEILKSSDSENNYRELHEAERLTLHILENIDKTLLE